MQSCIYSNFIDKYPEEKPGKAIPRGNFVVGAKPIALVLMPVLIWAAVYQLLIQ